MKLDRETRVAGAFWVGVFGLIWQLVGIAYGLEPSSILAPIFATLIMSPILLGTNGNGNGSSHRGSHGRGDDA